jgi:hypothetical protein
MNLLHILKDPRTQPRHPKGSSLGGRWQIKPGAKDILRNSKVANEAVSRGIRASARTGIYKDPKKAIARIRQLERELREKYDELATVNTMTLADGRLTPERRDLHQKIIDDIFKDADAKYLPPDGQKPQVLLMAGKPGAGKSGFGKELKIYDKSKYLMLDSDEFKMKFPEYDPERPWIVHREASDLMNRVGIVARAKGLNIVYDMTMKKPPNQLVEQFKNHGYVVEMHHMKVSQETSYERAAYRFNNDGANGEPGRLVSPAIISEMVTTDKVFTGSKHLADHWTEYEHEKLGSPTRLGAGGRYSVAKYLRDIFSKGVKR